MWLAYQKGKDSYLFKKRSDNESVLLVKVEEKDCTLRAYVCKVCAVWSAFSGFTLDDDIFQNIPENLCTFIWLFFLRFLKDILTSRSHNSSMK